MVAMAEKAYGILKAKCAFVQIDYKLLNEFRLGCLNYFLFFLECLANCFLSCHGLFLMIQSLIKKDRSDEKDPTISAFHNELATAYEDPSLMPANYTGNNDSHTTPLLHTL